MTAFITAHHQGGRVKAAKRRKRSYWRFLQVLLIFHIRNTGSNPNVIINDVRKSPFIIRQIRQNYGISHKRKVWGITRILRSTQASTWQRSQSASARVQKGITGVPVRHSRNPDPGLKNQKVLPGTFPIEGGGRTQVTLKSFRRSPRGFQHAHKRVLRGVTRSTGRKAKTCRSTDKMRQRGLSGHLNGSSERGFPMRARGRS